MTHSSILNNIAFAYRGFWIESEPFDQAENGHPEDGITYTSYVYTSKEDRDALEDEIDALHEVYDSPDELKIGVKRAIDAYIGSRAKKKSKEAFDRQKVDDWDVR